MKQFLCHIYRILRLSLQETLHIVAISSDQHVNDQPSFNCLHRSDIHAIIIISSLPIINNVISIKLSL